MSRTPHSGRSVGPRRGARMLTTLLGAVALTAQAHAAEPACEPEPGDVLEALAVAPLHRVWGTGPDNIWAVGASGYLARWNGTAFARIESTAHDHLRALWGTGADDIWAVGCTESVHWDGHAARLVPSANGYCLGAIWGPARDRAWAVGRGGTLLRLEQGAFHRQPVPVADNIELTAIWGTGANDIWIVGQQGTILHGDGQSFAPVHPGSAGVHATLTSGWSSGPSDVWIVGEAGVILRFDGARWQRLRSGTREKLHAVWGSASDDVWIVGDGGQALHWNGRVLLPIHEGGAKNHWGVWGCASGGRREVYIATGEGPLRHRLQPGPPPPGGACEPAARRCQGDAVEVCTSQGTGWRTLTPCAGGCQAGACAPPCTPGDRRCSGAGIEVCTSRGSATRWATEPVDAAATIALQPDPSGESGGGLLGGVAVARELWECALSHDVGCPGRQLVRESALGSCPGFARWQQQRAAAKPR